ncbi:WD domain, G-beta repeat [Rubripirellula tenax]|uniref:WD domain, G-beta repeat n=1 Tax=Rubripirellula tenax TaxID=2528015 RepID=A0A5C6FIG2_9BACT|nr:c-type cytochrome domain-containing protein [Rubripirellula tenax]TWU60710.1 WD domain, G-beta repeat [Rubripirellula tenax]
MSPITRTLLILLFAIVTRDATWAVAPVDYARDVFPIFQTYCIGCHAEGDEEGGFVMESHAGLMAGGENGAAITAGEPNSSRLFLMATGKLEPVMPPDGEERPSEEELATIAAWIEQGAIEQGAIGPDGDVPIKRELRTPKIATNENVRLPVTAIATSTDGSLRAVARFAKIEVIDNHDKVIQTISGAFGKVNSLHFSNDAARLLVASGTTGAYGEAFLFDVATGTVISQLVGHRDVLYSAEFSPDESIIATAGYDRTIILWDSESGEAIRKLTGHNGAIFDLAFSPDGKVLVSGCADDTAKVWNVATGERLDTLSQPEGEVFDVAVTADGKFVLAASADNRLRVWRLRSIDKPRINPIVATRFVDEAPLVRMAILPDGKSVLVMSEAGNIKVIRTSDWTQVASLEPVGAGVSDLSITGDGTMAWVTTMNGDVVRRALPKVADQRSESSETIKPVYLDLGELTKLSEAGEADGLRTVTDVPRGAVASGKIESADDTDYFRFTARGGEVWAIETDAKKVGDNESRIDPIVAILDDGGAPVLRTRLQAVRDSYFTFRGKDSSQTGDFRVFNWEEMKLNEFLYSGGEVTRLAVYPRGPDSGFNVYPNEGSRWTYFGTSHTTHALGEPAFVVRPLGKGESPTANGLPVFDIYYENDDDPMRLAGSSSRILFTAPADGMYTIRVGDTRGEGGNDYTYEMTLRAATPSFDPKIDMIDKPLKRGAGREATLRIDRLDGFDGPVTFDVLGMPDEAVSNFPVTIESGQRFAHAVVWIAENTKGWDGEVSPQVVARGRVAGRVIERQVGTLGKLTVTDRPNVIPTIVPIGEPTIVPIGEPSSGHSSNWTLSVRRGETVAAKVVLDRRADFKNEVSFGKEESGRNAAHGVYVDNIGLNGLLALEGMTERDFFITADPVAKLGKRTFFLKANVDGGLTTHPINIDVLP